MSKYLIDTEHHDKSTSMSVTSDDGKYMAVDWMGNHDVFITVIDDGEPATIKMHMSTAKDFFRLLAGQQRTHVSCSLKSCTHNKSGICILDEINLCSACGCDSTCEDYTTIDE